MKAILILAHGSREKDTEKTLAQILEKVKEKSEIALITEAFLQFSDKKLETGLVELMEAGATEITVVPYFLFEGVHIREDIPAELEAFKETHPEVVIHFGKTLGADERLADILVDHIKEVI